MPSGASFDVRIPLVPSKPSVAIRLVLFLACATPARAQQHRIYVFGAAGRTVREMPVLTSDDTPLNRSGIWELSGGGGVWVRRSVGIEGSIAFPQPQHVTWFYNYQFGGEAKHLDTADRDIPILGRLRYAATAGRRVGVDVIVGGGWTWHRAVSTVLASCGTGSQPQPCVPLAQPRDDETFATWEPALTAGLDMPVRASSRVAVAPSLHAVISHRRQFMTGYDHRGPVSGGGAVFSFGAVVSWRDR